MSEYQGTSPIKPRQLHDLRLLPTATDPRPTFFWSAESPRDTVVGPGTPYPKLLWHGETHQEITVTSATEEQAKLSAGYVTTPPTAQPIDPLADVRDAFAGLTEEEQQLILDAQAKERRARMTERLAGLSDADLERLLAGAQKKAGKKKSA